MTNELSAKTTAASQCSIANTPEAREQVYRLRYACYRRKGSIDVSADEQFRDSFDTMPNSFSFLVRNGDEAAATVRISVVQHKLGWTDSPVCHVYANHPAFEEIARQSFVEASRLCFGPQARRDSFLSLVGNMAALAEFYDVEWLIVCPRVEHASTYEKLFGFKPLAAPRQYFGVKFQTQLLGIRRADLEAYIRGMRPMENAWAAARKRLVSAVAPVLGMHAA